MFPAKEAPASSNMLVSWAELFQKKVSRLIPPRSASSEAKATGRPMSRRRASKRARQAGGEQAGSRQPRQTAAGRASRRQGRQARKQASKSRQAGKQAKAGRQAGVPGSFDGKEKQGQAAT